MKLLYKELALAAHPTSIVFSLLGCLVIVPSYPFTVIFMFGCLSPYITFSYARETNDTWYTAVLPVTKKEIVKGKFSLVILFQLFHLLFSIPFVFLRNVLGIDNNPVGIDPTIAWYGFGLIIFAVFDFIFLTSYYKSGFKAGKAFIFASIPMLFLMVITESSVYLPNLKWLESLYPSDLLIQTPILLTGIICYSSLLALSYRISCKRFQKVDL